jgi:taurine transport system permease protein
MPDLIEAVGAERTAKARRAPPRDGGGHAGRFAIGAASVSVMLLAWWAVTASGFVAPDLLAGPGAVVAAFVHIAAHGYRDTSLGQDAGATVGRCLAGFGLAVLAGIPLGLWMGMNRIAAGAFDWIVQVFRPLPPLSYMVLLILWFGTGDESKVALLFLTAFPIVASAATAGVRGVRLERVQAARSLGASPAQIFRLVVLPSALPMILTGMSIALAAAFSTVVAAELLAANDGLGWLVISAGHFLQNDIVLLAILLLGLIGLTLAALLRAADRRFVHWRGRD